MNNRPLSPHLQVYRLPLPALLSITHRATGVFLAIGTILLSLWIISLATGADEFQSVKGFIGSFVGRVLLLGWTFSLFFHLFNGVRHLYWDMAKGLELKSVYTSGYITMAAAAVFTLLVWIIGYVS